MSSVCPNNNNTTQQTLPPTSPPPIRKESKVYSCPTHQFFHYLGTLQFNKCARLLQKHQARAKKLNKWITQYEEVLNSLRRFIACESMYYAASFSNSEKDLHGYYSLLSSNLAILTANAPNEIPPPSATATTTSTTSTTTTTTTPITTTNQYGQRGLLSSHHNHNYIMNDHSSPSLMSMVDDSGGSISPSTSFVDYYNNYRRRSNSSSSSSNNNNITTNSHYYNSSATVVDDDDLVLSKLLIQDSRILIQLRLEMIAFYRMLARTKAPHKFDNHCKILMGLHRYLDRINHEFLSKQKQNSKYELDILFNIIKCNAQMSRYRYKETAFMFWKVKHLLRSWEEMHAGSSSPLNLLSSPSAITSSSTSTSSSSSSQQNRSSSSSSSSRGHSKSSSALTRDLQQEAEQQQQQQQQQQHETTPQKDKLKLNETTTTTTSDNMTETPTTTNPLSPTTFTDMSSESSPIMMPHRQLILDEEHFSPDKKMNHDDNESENANAESTTSGVDDRQPGPLQIPKKQRNQEGGGEGITTPQQQQQSSKGIIRSVFGGLFKSSDHKSSSYTKQSVSQPVTPTYHGEQTAPPSSPVKSNRGKQSVHVSIASSHHAHHHVSFKVDETDMASTGSSLRSPSREQKKKVLGRSYSEGFLRGLQDTHQQQTDSSTPLQTALSNMTQQQSQLTKTNLHRWFTILFSFSVSKFTFIFREVLSSCYQGPENFNQLCAGGIVDYMSWVHSFYDLASPHCICMIYDTQGEPLEVTTTMGYSLKRKLTETEPLSGIRSYPCIFAYPSTVDKSILMQLHWPNILSLIMDSTHELDSQLDALCFTDARTNASYFICRVDTRMYLCTIFDMITKGKPKIEKITNEFMYHMNMFLRDQKLFGYCEP